MSEINVTPLVDVTLVLLIVFMITVPAIVGTAPIKVNLPETASAVSDSEQLPLLVSLRQEPEGELAIYLNEKRTDTASLPKTISELGVSPTEQRVTLAADKGIPYGEVVKLMDLLHSLGLRKISLITKHMNVPGARSDATQ